ncbi:MAG: hypothetical protein CMF56_02375 [Leifsonia sp.]|nr:hypothetical protein [Leifsonia sp.]|tara:strand:- start:12200 stop:12673 length:474 start_codon:yes stop_codon:yes gene_type:complete
MVAEQRNAWIALAVAVIGYAVYFSLVMGAAAGGPLAEADYITPMLIVIIGSVIGTVVLTVAVAIIAAIVAGARDPKTADETVRRVMQDSDERDRAINKAGELAARWLVVAGALAALVFAWFEFGHFWIANVVFLGFYASAIFGAIFKLAAYRWGLRA